MKRKLEEIEAGGQVIDDWDLYNTATDKPYIVLVMKGLDGHTYEVTADIQYVERRNKYVY